MDVADLRVRKNRMDGEIREDTGLVPSSIEVRMVEVTVLEDVGRKFELVEI